MLVAINISIPLRLFVDMRTNGTIILPGFNSHAAWGQWTLDENTLNISQADTFDFVYNGNYDIDFSSNRLILKSNQTILYCHPRNIQVSLPFWQVTNQI